MYQDMMDNIGCVAAQDEELAAAMNRELARQRRSYVIKIDPDVPSSNTAFAALLQSQTALPVVMWDERRTSVEAHAILHASGKRMKAHKKQVDAVAASLILEGYLGSPDYLRACRAE